MTNDRALGGLILVTSVAGIVLYGWLVFLPEWRLLVLQVTGFLAVAAVLAIGAWIGYTMATTPAPMPFDEIEGVVDTSRSDE